MTEEEKKRRLESLELQWREYYRRARKYRILMEGARQEMKRVEEEIKNL